MAQFFGKIFTRNNMATASLLGGFFLAAVGAAQYNLGLGLIVGGAGLAIFGYLLGQE